MQVMKIRRVGNSNVVSVPKSFVKAGYEDGRPVVVELLESGELLISPVENHRELLRSRARVALDRHRETLDKLAAYDRGELATPERPRPSRRPTRRSLVLA